MQDADDERLVALSDALGFLPELRLEADDARRASHGVAVQDLTPSVGTVRLSWTTQRADRAGRAPGRTAPSSPS